MTQLYPNKYSTEQVMMTLSAISYASFDSSARLQEILDNADALEQSWETIWWAGRDAHLTYVVKKRLSDEYAIVIKGPVFRFGLSFLFDLFEDLDIGRQVRLLHSRHGDAKIAAGILDAVQSINDLVFNGRTLPQLTDHFPRGSKVYVTGHSLGGTFASVYTVLVTSRHLRDLEIIPFTFGAPSAGNKPFADLFDVRNSQCLFPQSSRCINSLDMIPFAWHDLQGIPALGYGEIRCPLNFTLCLDNIVRLLILSRVTYLQPPLKLTLGGQAKPDTSFFEDSMVQHHHNTYLALLHLSPMTSGPGFSFKQQKEEKAVTTS